MHIFLSVAIQTVPNPAAKLLLFFELTKFFGKKMHFGIFFFFGTLFVR